MNRTLTLHADTPREIQELLKQKFGYYLRTYVAHEYICFAKDTFTKAATNKAQPLTAEERVDLEARCDRIAYTFQDPYAESAKVRTRLHNIAQSMRPEASQFVMEYMEENFPLNEKALSL